MPLKRSSFICLLLLVWGLASCNGGETGTGFHPDPDPDPQPTTVIGPITGFGSVIVNGIHFDIADSTIYVDGQIANESQLSVGMVVTVHGTVNGDGVTGNAQRVELKNEVKGYVAENHIDEDGTLLVLGQRVVAYTDTVFVSQVPKIRDLNQLTPTSFVAVNGYSNGAGTIFAEYIELLDDKVAQDVQLQGLVSGLTVDTFMLGDVLIGFDGLTQFAGMQAADLANGIKVLVVSQRGLVGNTILADRIELLALPPEEAGVEITLVGIVTQSINSDRFQINGKTIEVNAGTQFEGGLKAGIVEGVKLAVNGVTAGDNRITAQHISYNGISQVTIASRVSAINEATESFTLLGESVYVNQYTQFSREGYSNRQFSLVDINTGDSVSVRVFADESGRLIATRIDQDGEEQDQLKGVVESVDASTMMMKGLPVPVDVRQLSGISAYLDKTITVQGSYDAQGHVFIASRLGGD